MSECGAIYHLSFNLLVSIRITRNFKLVCVCVQVLYMCACTGRQFNFHFCDITAPLGTRTIIEFSFITWLYYIYRSSRWKYGRDVTRTRKPYYRWLKKVSLSTLSAFTLTTVVRNPPSESTLIIERRCCRCLSILQGPINEPTSSSLIITRAIVRFRHWWGSQICVCVNWSFCQPLNRTWHP